MLPDDPRHGTARGYSQHRRDGDMCEPCRGAATRRDKEYRLERIHGGNKRVPLGHTASKLLEKWNLFALSDVTGIRPQSLSQLRSSGPEKMVARTTRVKILSAGRPVTALGIARRLQALAALGWSNADIENVSGVERTNVGKLRRQERGCFIRRTTIAAVCDAYEQLSMTLPEPSRSATHTKHLALSKGYLPPLAWDDIDDPDEQPNITMMERRPKKVIVSEFTNTRSDIDSDIDPVVVQRILAGDFHLRATPAERLEVAENWPGSRAELERLTGWNIHRDLRRIRKDGAA